MNDSDASFLKWAMRAICLWNNEKIPMKFTHIHGSADRILPFRKINGAKKIENGGHLMVYTLAKDVSIVMKSAFSE